MEGEFTFQPNTVADVVEYRWSLDQSPPANVVSAAADGTARVTVTPAKDGQRFLYVMSIDGAGNASEVREYPFKVSAPPPVEAWWPFDEDGGTTADDVIGDHLASFAGGVTRSPGLRGSCLTFDGSTGYAFTAGPVLATDQTFTVAAWVRLTDISGFRTVVSQDGNRSSAFYLQYRHDVDRWAFTMRVSDTDAGQSFSSFSDYRPIPTEEWTHLIGVYDAVADLLLLYVDGVLQVQQTPFTSAWTSSGGVQIGRGKYAGANADYFAGDIDDVRVYQRKLLASEIARLSDKG